MDCMAPTRHGRRRGIGAVTGVSSGRQTVGSSAALVRLAGLRSNRPPPEARDFRRQVRQLVWPARFVGLVIVSLGLEPQELEHLGRQPAERAHRHSYFA